jgi:dsRNA-specific ribonuclease
VVEIEGPDHKRTYTVACVVNGRDVSLGEGSSKKEAEESAAAAFLDGVRKT